MKIFTVLTIFLIFTVSAVAQIPTWSWAKNMAYGTYLPGSNGRATRSELVDKQGNIYIATSYRDKVYLDTDSLVTSTSSKSGIFIVKYNASGSLVWKKSGECSNSGSFIGTTGLSSDNNGKVYLSYYFLDTLHFDGNTVLGGSLGTLQVMSLNASDGSFNWTTEVAPKYNGTSQLGVNPAGDAVIAYTNIQTAQDTFGLVKLNSSGTKTLERKHLLGTYSYFNLLSICTTGNDIFITGSYTNNFSLDSHSFSVATTDFVMVKFDNTGSVSWAGGGKSSGTQKTTSGNIEQDASGSFYFIGTFTGTFKFVGSTDSLVVTGKASGGNELMYTKFASDGSVLWMKQAQGIKNHTGKVIRLGADHKLYIMGSLGSKSMHLGTDSTLQEGINNTNPYFIAQLDTSGNTHWLKRVNHTGYLQGNTNLFVDNSINIYFAGSYDNIGINIEPFTLPTVYSNKVFYAKTTDLATPTDVRTITTNELPTAYNLEQNYPNPFNPTTTFVFDIPVTGFVSLKVFDVMGREVVTLVNQTVTSGKHEVTLNASNLSSGVYFSRLSVGNFVQTRKIVLQK